MVADSHHFDEEQDLDPNQSEKMDTDPHQSDSDPQPCWRLLSFLKKDTWYLLYSPSPLPLYSKWERVSTARNSVVDLELFQNKNSKISLLANEKWELVFPFFFGSGSKSVSWMILPETDPLRHKGWKGYGVPAYLSNYIYYSIHI